MTLTKEQILGLDEKELKRWVADVLGWRTRKWIIAGHHAGFQWVTPAEVEFLNPGIIQRWVEIEGIDKLVECPYTLLPRWTSNQLAALPLFWYLQTTYGAACILTNAEWGEKMATVVVQGQDSGKPAPLPLALCRMVLLLAERDKQKAASPASVEVAPDARL